MSPEADSEQPVTRGSSKKSSVDTNLRPQATSVPDLNVVARIYLDSLRNGHRPIEALMEKFNVDRESAKGWPALCRDAGLLPDRDQPQIVALPDDRSHRLRIVG